LTTRRLSNSRRTRTSEAFSPVLVSDSRVSSRAACCLLWTSFPQLVISSGSQPSSRTGISWSLVIGMQLDCYGSRLYTPAERKFLKDEYDSEYKFLRIHELSIPKDEEREEGRAIFSEIVYAAKEAGECRGCYWRGA
jgi:hypothetical protein